MRASIALVLLIAACGSDPSAPPDPPVRDPEVPTDMAAGRRIRRLSADQFNRSLQVATGQTWTRYAQFSSALGKADWSQITQEGDDIGVTFEKLTTDAARETCRRAVTAPGQAIMRFAALADRPGAGDAKIRANLKYLLMRFHGVDVTADDDPRMTPWLSILQGGTAPTTDALMGARWEAVCIGLATHPDFLTY